MYNIQQQRETDEKRKGWYRDALVPIILLLLLLQVRKLDKGNQVSEGGDRTVIVLVANDNTIITSI